MDKPTQLPGWLRWGQNWPLPARQHEPPQFVIEAAAASQSDAPVEPAPAALGITVITPLKPTPIAND